MGVQSIIKGLNLPPNKIGLITLPNLYGANVTRATPVPGVQTVTEGLNLPPPLGVGLMYLTNSGGLQMHPLHPYFQRPWICLEKEEGMLPTFTISMSMASLNCP
jgi:hypothetical protein